MSKEILYLKGVEEYSSNWEYKLKMLLRVINAEVDLMESTENDLQALPSLIWVLLETSIRLFFPHLLHVKFMQVRKRDYQFRGCIEKTYVSVGDKLKEGDLICGMKDLGDMVANSDGYVARLCPVGRRFLYCIPYTYAYVAVFGQVKQRADLASCRSWLESQEIQKTPISTSLPILPSYHPGSLSERQREQILPKICEIILIAARTSQKLIRDLSEESLHNYLAIFAEHFFPMANFSTFGPISNTTCMDGAY